MYPVSQDYITAIKKPYRVRRLTGYIGTTPFTEANIVKESMTLTNSCSEGDEVKIGSVYRGQLEVVFTGITIQRRTWMYQPIQLTEELKLEDGTWEAVPLGVFIINECYHREDGVYCLAYDYMFKFDKKFAYSTTSGTPYDFLNMICEDCGVSMAQTEQEIRALPNGTRGFVLYADNDIETYRDLLFWVAQTMGCFATINRLGQLELRQYGLTSVIDIGVNDRWDGGSFSDFLTKYTGVSVVQIEKEKTYYKGAEVDDGLTYNLGSNPLLQGISLDAPLGEILNSLARIEFTPFQLDMPCWPFLDLGDRVTFPGGRGAGCVGSVMYYSYRFHSTYTINGFGSNPALANAHSKTDKQIAGIMSHNSVANTLQFYTYTNAKDISIGSDYKEIIKIRFGSLKSTMVIFQAEINLEASLTVLGNIYNDIVGRVKYILNNIELDYQPAETWLDGEHLLHLMYFFPISDGQLNTLSVRMKCDNGILSIDAGNIRAGISGQGLASSSDWDGHIDLEDNITDIAFATTPALVDAYGNEVDTSLVTPESEEYEGTIIDFNFETMPTIDFFLDGCGVNKKPIAGMLWREVAEYTWDELEEGFVW